MIKPLTAILALALGFGYSTATAGATGRIAYINLTLENNSIRLNGTKIVPGTLKTKKTASLFKNRLYFSVSTQSGEIIHEGTTPDPTLLRVEYADENGNLHINTAQRDRVDFSIRIPYDPSAHRLTVRRIRETPPGLKTVEEHSDLLGSFVIDLTEGGGQ
jgi:hypothetical protein